MKPRFFRWAAPLAVAGMLLVPQTGVAQTPTADAELCDLAPLELPLFDATPPSVLVSQSPEATPAAGNVSPEIVRATLDQFVACTNTGDPTLVWAVFTPRLLASTFADPGVHYLPAFEQMLDYPGIVAEHPLELVSVDQIDELPDGRIDVTATFRSGDEEWTDMLTLALVDGQWLIDDVRLDTPAE